MKTEAKIIYDLAVIGNGVAAQSLLWNLSLQKGTQDRKSQTFSLAHIYSNEIAPACTLRSSATVSLNGIEEDVSQLGNDMREGFFLFDEIVKKYHPQGVEEVTRTVVSTNENDTKKLTRRYKTLIEVKHPRIKNIYPGAQYNSYIITPEVFTKWMDEQITIQKTDYPFFVRDLEKVDDHFKLKLQNGDYVYTKKIVLAIGAFAKIFEKFLAPPDAESIEVKNTIKAGSYLEKNIHLGDKSFYLSIDGNQVLYRKNPHEEKLIIGSVTTIGAYESPDIEGLVKLHEKLKPLLTFDLGEFSDFKITTGLRHKGPKRLLILNSVDSEEKIFRINGLYKNGYTLSFLAAKRLTEKLF